MASWCYRRAATVVVLLSVLATAMLYHVATPVRSGWLRQLPGAVAAVTLGAAAAAVLRVVVAASLGGTSLYGPLAAPIVVLLRLYLVALSVLVGAALNAAVDQIGSAQSEAEQYQRQGGQHSLHQRAA